jgi:hypothetical protein
VYLLFGFGWPQTSEAGPGNIPAYLYVGSPTDTEVVAGFTAGSKFVPSTPTTINDGQRHHIVGVAKDTSTDLKLYVDGVETAFNPDPPLVDTVSQYGAWVGWAGSPADPPYGGIVDEVATYDTELTQARVAAHYAAGIAPWDGDTTGTRIGRLLDLAGWPAADRDIDTGDSTLGPATLNTRALTALKAVEAAEQGRFYIDGQGRAVFKSRYSVLTDTESTVSQATFGTGGGELPYRGGSLIVSRPRDFIANDVTFVDEQGGSIRVTDTASQTDYGLREYQRTVATTDTARELRDAAAYYLDRYKQPGDRIPSVTVVVGGPQSPMLWPKILTLDLGYRVTVRHPHPTGVTVTRQALIEGIEETFTNFEYQVTYLLSPADLRGYWIWGSSEWGESVDPTTRWAY